MGGGNQGGFGGEGGGEGGGGGRFEAPWSPQDILKRLPVAFLRSDPGQASAFPVTEVWEVLQPVSFCLPSLLFCDS